MAQAQGTTTNDAEATQHPLVNQVKGEYVPPGLNGGNRNKYREAVHRYKRAYGLPANFPVPKEILDQIAGSVKNGDNVVDAADNADPPPEGDSGKSRRDKDKGKKER